MTSPEQPDVEFPELRAELQYALATLADEGFQQRVWIERRPPRSPYEYDFDMACHAILDDTEILSERSGLVGAVLRNDEELASVTAVASALQSLIQDIGLRGTIQSARVSILWPDVVKRASESTRLLGRPAEFP